MGLGENQIGKELIVSVVNLWGSLSLNIFSDVDIGEILVAESGNEQIYRVSNGVAKFGLSYDAELIRFDFMPNIHRANLVISAAVDYEQKLPRVTFVVTLKPVLANRNIIPRDPIASETEFFKVVVRFSRFTLLPEPARFPAPDSDLLAL